MHELHIKHQTPKIFCDNPNVVSLTHNQVLHSRTNHMKLDVFLVKEKVINKSLIVSHLPAVDQWVDVLTKPLSPLIDFCFSKAYLALLTNLHLINYPKFEGEGIKDIRVIL